MKILIACEYSGRVRDAFAALGHDAMSCDFLPSETPGNHYPLFHVNRVSNKQVWTLKITTYLECDDGCTSEYELDRNCKAHKAKANKYQTKCWHIQTLLINPVDKDMTLKAIKTVIERVGEF